MSALALVRAEALEALDDTYEEVFGGENEITEALRHIRHTSEVSAVPALIADTSINAETPSLPETLREIRRELLERADSIRDFALAIKIPDGDTVFTMSLQERDAAYEKLRTFSRSLGATHIRKIVVIETAVPGSWDASFSDGMEAYARAGCPTKWIAYDAHGQAYVTNSGSLRLDNEDNGRNLTDAQAFVEICRVE